MKTYFYEVLQFLFFFELINKELTTVQLLSQKIYIKYYAIIRS